MSTQSEMASMTRSQWQHYVSQFGDLEQQKISEIGSTRLADQAKQTAVTQQRVGAESLQRSQDRYGLGGTPGAVQARLNRTQAMGNATNAAQTINTARIDDREASLGLGSTLMQQGRGVASQGMQGMGTAANNEAGRNAANDQAKATAKASRTSTMASLGALAILAF